MTRSWPRASSALVTVAVVAGGITAVTVGPRTALLVAGLLGCWAVILGVGFND